jgi:hypothetical protein
MERYLIELKDKRKRHALLALLRDLDYITLVDAYTDVPQARQAREFLSAMREIEQNERGELKLPEAREAINGL